MAYDEVLADRVRELLRDEPGLTERKMFGGLGFMLDGHMVLAAGSRGALMVRADPEADLDPLLRPMEMRGREMRGWLETAPDTPLAQDDLERIAATSVAWVRTLPPKG